MTVRQKQKRALETIIAALSEQLAALKGRILMEKALLRSRLEALRQVESVRRVAQQAMFMEYIRVTDKYIDSLQQQASEIQMQRQEKLAQLTELHKQIKSLEQLKQKAFMEYQYQQQQIQQKQQDENAAQRYARQHIAETSGK